MFDIFYIGTKPNLFPHEQPADSVEHARQQSRTRYCWIIDYLTDYSDFDFLWEPVPWQNQYVHAWSGPWPDYYSTYLVPKNATDHSYHVHDRVLGTRIVDDNYEFLTAAEFDRSWTPHPWDPPYVYVFGNQHYPGQIMPTVKYTVPGAVEEKYVDHVSAVLLPSRTNWEILEPVDETAWDWSWVPDPGDPAYIYVFGNQWNPPELKASVRYVVPGATEIKYMSQRTRRLPQPALFTDNLAVDDFDYSWEPDPTDPPMTYVFGNQWNSAVLEPTVVYTTGGSAVKYVDHIVARVAADMRHWRLLDAIAEFDYSWRPDPTDPPYIYVFGNTWYPAESRPALEYHVPGAVERKYMDSPRAQRVQDPSKFCTLRDCDFDYSWEPDPGSPPYNYVFGNQWHAGEIMPTVEYRMLGATDTKYIDYPRATLKERHDNHWHTIIDCQWDYSWVPDPGDPAYIYVFGNQHWPAEKMPTVEYHVPGAVERKYMDSPCAELLPDRTHWTIPAGVNEDTVDFTWVPDPGEPPYIYQFATQHQKTGGPVYTVPGATEVKYLEHLQIKIETATVPVVEINHLDGAVGQIPGVIKTIRYFDNYRDTLIRLAKSLVGEHEFVWVCSSICDYTNFDFSWHPERWQTTMLHVFASDGQKFGDTFYMHVPTFAERAEKKQLLEWYSVNYVPRISVPRRPVPVIQHVDDTHVESVKNTDWPGPLAVFTTDSDIKSTPVAVSLWREETKTITPLIKGASSIVIPKVAVPYIKTQLYDYPYIDKTKTVLPSKPQDVIFISNGESMAEQNWQQLLSVCPGAKRSDGITGRERAYKAAAELSTTPWFFAVFAKTEVLPTFKFDFQPDLMQQPKHYIFHSRNPLNGLEYGAMNINLYNRQLVLDTEPGLDFTLSAAHEVVPICASISRFNTDPWVTWRSAFREVLKLKREVDLGADVEIQHRLNVWTTRAIGENAEWCLQGSQDALDYYETVNGDYEKLRLSFDWAWLQEYYYSKYQTQPWLESI